MNVTQEKPRPYTHEEMLKMHTSKVPTLFHHSSDESTVANPNLVVECFGCKKDMQMKKWQVMNPQFWYSKICSICWDNEYPNGV